MKKLLFITIFILFSCTFPQDPENSLEEAKRSNLKVGIVENPPFTQKNNENYNGNEIEIIKSFASENNLNIDFIEGSESDLIEKIKHYKLHIIAGGFTKKTIWKKEAGTTLPYDSSHVFLIPKGENKLLQQLESFIIKNYKK